MIQLKLDRIKLKIFMPLGPIGIVFWTTHFIFCFGPIRSLVGSMVGGGLVYMVAQKCHYL